MQLATISGVSRSKGHLAAGKVLQHRRPEYHAGVGDANAERKCRCSFLCSVVICSVVICSAMPQSESAKTYSVTLVMCGQPELRLCPVGRGDRTSGRVHRD